MTQSQVATLGFAIAGVLFLVAALIPMLRGSTVQIAFLPIGVVFLVLAVALRRRGPDVPPPAQP
jgi:hypothetical protein